jgi:hypothetical protein
MRLLTLVKVGEGPGAENAGRESMRTHDDNPLGRGRGRAASRTGAALAGLAAAVLLAVAAGAVSACGDTAAGRSFETVSPPPQSAPATAIAGGGLPPGCSCHSSNRRLAAMHRLFSVKDCATCHTGDPEPTAERPWTEERLAGLRERMRSEAVCLECHRRGETAVPTRLAEMQGRLFCPVDGTLYTRAEAVPEGGHYVCPEHGDRLVDVDAVAAASEKSPSNAYCVACHRPGETLAATHASVAQAAPGTDLGDCLSCHTSHSDCDSCHH